MMTMAKIKIAVCGATGKMGRSLISAISQDAELELSGALELAGDTRVGRDAGESFGLVTGVEISSDVANVAAASNVMIDFTRPEGTLVHLQQCVDHKVAMVIGTTGFTGEEKSAIEAAAQSIPIVMAPNMSVGVNVVLNLLKNAAAALSEGYDIEIVEAHHRHKVDAPSGTAVKMGEVIADVLGRDLADCAVYGREGHTGERADRTIGFATVRGGDIVGDHTVMFAGTGERVEISHKASDRSNFAIGALRAAKFLSTRDPGLYDMNDVLGL
jgi:4-hydroxy-tetrahydrodipicolinate reductase